MKKIYIAGPMTGYEGLNFAAFNSAAKELRERGYVVSNPAEIAPDKNIGWSDAMRLDIAEMMTCDTVAVLDGWEKSNGASLEIFIAKMVGIKVVLIGDVLVSNI